MKLKYSGWFFLLVTSAVLAKGMTHHAGVWTNMPISGSLTKDEKWNYYLEPQLRFIDNKYKFEYTALFAGGFYQVCDDLAVYLGVFRNYVKQSNGNTTQEYRLWEQISWKMMATDSREVRSRTRLEQRRRIPNTGVAQRLRERMSFLIAYNQFGDRFLVLSDEVFFQLNKPRWVTQRTFIQNRATVGVQMPVMKNTTIEFGYLNQFILGNPHQINNILYLTYSIDAG